MTTWIIQFAFGDWNNYSVQVMMLLIAIWLVAAVIKLNRMVRATVKRRRVIQMPAPAPAEQEWNPFSKAA